VFYIILKHVDHTQRSGYIQKERASERLGWA